MITGIRIVQLMMIEIYNLCIKSTYRIHNDIIKLNLINIF